MNKWSLSELNEVVHNFENLSDANKKDLMTYLNKWYPPEKIALQKKNRKKALENTIQYQTILTRVKQRYPVCLSSETVEGSMENLAGYAIMLTAGGDGERLRLSLYDHGYKNDQLHDFTKATFPLPDFFQDFGTLHVNLSLISKLSKEYGIDIPVIVTTGPKNTTTARVISSIIKQNNSFGIKNCTILAQEERVHFTQDEKMAYTLAGTVPRPIINPDETGGPVMKLKSSLPNNSGNTLGWLQKLGCSKIVLLQATALYDPMLLGIMATCGKNYDGMGIGIQRTAFPESDPYGTYVTIEDTDHTQQLRIVEQDVRNEETRLLQQAETGAYLPYNTGLYAFDIDLIQDNELPDFATPPKEVLPGIEKAPKIGYAATDIVTFAKNPAVLTVPQDSYGVLKKYEDLNRLSKIGKKFQLHTLCKEMSQYS